MTSDDFEMMQNLIVIANRDYDGHLTVLKFTTNWRVGFVTPTNRDDIKELHVGATFDEAASKAIASVENA